MNNYNYHIRLPISKRDSFRCITWYLTYSRIPPFYGGILSAHLSDRIEELRIFMWDVHMRRYGAE